MHSFVCPSSNYEVIIIKVGSATYHPSQDNLEDIRKVILKDKKAIKNINEWCKIPTEINIIAESPEDKEYVYYCTSDEDYYNPTDQDIKYYQEVFKEGLTEADFIIFTYSALDIKRISKALLPFI